MKIMCVGKLKEEYLRAAANGLSARINTKTMLKIIEMKDESVSERLSVAEANTVKDTEGTGILKHISDNDFVGALVIKGKQFTTGDFAALVDKYSNGRHKDGSLVFVIGGTLGLSNKLLQRANVKISFSEMTFPHQLMRVILLDQIAKAVQAGV